jgi:hypothetical protein
MSKHGVSGPDAARLVREANAHPGDRDGVLRDGRLEPTRRAWAAGEVSAERAVEIATTVAKLDPTIPTVRTDEVQVDLLAHSPRLGFRQFQRLCAHVVHVVDPDGADAVLERQLLAEEDRALLQTALSFRRVGDGTTRLNGVLPDAQADMLKTALDAYTSPRHTSRRLDGVPDGREGWTYPQRLGHGLIELVEHLPVDELPQHGVAAPSVVVTMTLDQLHGAAGVATLDTGTMMTAGQARRWVCNTKLIPTVLGGASQILDLGMGHRLYDRHQRIALAVRDAGCVFPSCERPPKLCEAHHIVSRSRGGPTDINNGCLLCPYHHHLIHRGEWQVVMSADGIPEIIPPARIDPDRKPLRHERLQHRRC